MRPLLVLVPLLLVCPSALASGERVGHGAATYTHDERAGASEDYACPGLSVAFLVMGADLRWTMGGGSPPTACSALSDYPTHVEIPAAALQGDAASGYWARGVTDCTSWAFTLEPLSGASALRYAVHDTCSGDARDTVEGVLSF